MPTIPKLSTPLAKLIRTGEGVLLYLFNLAAAAAVIVNDVAPAVAVKYAAIFNAVAFASRTVLKVVATTQPLVGGPPIAPPPAIVSTVDQVLADIDAAAAAATAIQAQPGTPADQITTALSPSPGAVSPPAP